jgi:hypothetical protein
MPILFAIAYLLSQQVTSADVLAMMGRLPSTEMGHAPYAWDRVGHAQEIAEAIATVAPDRETAATMAVYAVYEGGNRRCAVGDHGKAAGPFQVQGVPRAVACDPVQAARVWLAKARASWADCASLAPDDQLAELASGSCGHGRVLARRRAALARMAVVELGEE